MKTLEADIDKLRKKVERDRKRIYTLLREYKPMVDQYTYLQELRDAERLELRPNLRNVSIYSAYCEGAMKAIRAIIEMMEGKQFSPKGMLAILKLAGSSKLNCERWLEDSEMIRLVPTEKDKNGKAKDYKAEFVRKVEHYYKI